MSNGIGRARVTDEAFVVFCFAGDAAGKILHVPGAAWSSGWLDMVLLY